jgi:queuine/archaeosine tRNA-ribosyltransferase
VREMGQRHIGSKSLEIPNIFVSYRIRDYPHAGLRCHPWDMTGTQALLLNAFDLLANKRTKMFTNEVRKCKGKLHEYVEFDGPIMLDSGAFNFLQHQEINIPPDDVLNIGLELGADVSVVLDHPFPPNATPQEISARWADTRDNTRAMVEALAQHDGEKPTGFRLMPVLHGHDAETLKCALDDVTSILGYEPEVIGIGSLAPLARNGNTRKAVDVILEVRRLLPGAHVHCFSMGSALLMLFAFYCGADTVDSQTWIMSAAFKQVQLPGFHLTRLSPREVERDPVKYERTRRAFAKHLIRLIQDEGFAVKDWDTGGDWPITDERAALAYLSYLEDRDGINHVHRRACHNLYAFNFEAGRARQAMDAGILEIFIQERMKSTMYRRRFEYAVRKKSELR